MSDPAPRRRLPRFSLITLVVVVNVAGLMVWANMETKTSHTSESRDPRDRSVIHRTEVTTWERGWPLSESGKEETEEVIFVDGPPELNIGIRLVDGTNPIWPFEREHGSDLVKYLNWMAFIMCVAGTGITIEFLIRKFRKAKRHDG